MSSGLQRGTVRLMPYDPAWPQDFAAEHRALAGIFGNRAAAIEHVGSTAVPGLSAKPVIDIEAGLRRFADWRQFVTSLQAAGYTFMPDRVRTDEIFMPKGPERRRTHYLHIAAYDSAEWRGVLKFRDALRADAALCREYAALKRELARQYPGDRAAYSAGKAAFISRVVQ